ncbi:MAG TPA: DUF389 domain-containing protein [Candidatus Saccharimonadales bacterium]|nr:DUF389 domain-containing protein [Candidatus Saccharimonadales bacterium]
MGSKLDTNDMSFGADKRAAIAEISSRTKHDLDFYVLLIGATLLALGAIFMDSTPTLIASMIVAPLAYPILGVGLGFVLRSWGMAFRSLGMLVGSCVLVVAIGYSMTELFGKERVVNHQITFGGNHDIAFLLAVVAGAIAAYGLMRPKVASAITGVAIAVSLLPPLVATGVALAPGGSTFDEPFLLFLLNVSGILLASLLTFWLADMRAAYRNKS